MRIELTGTLKCGCEMLMIKDVKSDDIPGAILTDPGEYYKDLSVIYPCLDHALAVAAIAMVESGVLESE